MLASTCPTVDLEFSRRSFGGFPRVRSRGVTHARAPFLRHLFLCISAVLSAIFQIIQSIRMGMWCERSPPPLLAGPETDATASDSSRGGRLPDAPPPALPRGHRPALISVYSDAVCGADSFSMDSLKPRRLEYVCVWSFNRWCERVCYYCWRCAISVCSSVGPCYVRIIFF